MSPLVLDNAAEQIIDKAYEDAKGPIQLQTKRERYVVLTARDYAALETPLTQSDKESLLSGKRDLENGRVTELNTVLNELGAEYGF